MSTTTDISLYDDEGNIFAVLEGVHTRAVGALTAVAARGYRALVDRWQVIDSDAPVPRISLADLLPEAERVRIARRSGGDRCGS